MRAKDTGEMTEENIEAEFVAWGGICYQALSKRYTLVSTKVQKSQDAEKREKCDCDCYENKRLNEC
jgi:hypothetical protein